MSSCRVLVGLAAERAPLVPLVPGRNYGSLAWMNPMQRPRAAAAQSPVGSGRICYHPKHALPSPPSRRCFHTTPQPHHDRHPRTFHLTAPQPPSIRPHPSSNLTPTTPPLPEQFRSVMRLLTHPVLTKPKPNTKPNPTPTQSPTPRGTPRGMTMSSFTSLALSPTPVVSFNIATPSRTLDAVAASGRFNIHVLADDAGGARVADWFTGGNAEGRGGFERLAEGGVVVDGWGGGDGGSDNGGGGKEAPVLEGEGVLYVLRCRLLDDEPTKGLVRVRDHVIVLGEVLEIVEGTGAQREREEKFGLLYADRRYRQLGDCITPEEERKGS
ncbi:flavin reductase like domain-containing protein [Chaetomium sp. MPI-CAGE-AT-0009]|nr:flavin reductase like domain-containing protein [Chaetomium sp. MPI-CAGE-AT-0009]